MSKYFDGTTLAMFIKLELGGSRMERVSIWKNFLLLTVGGLLALHVNVVNADTSDHFDVDTDSSDECVLEQE